MALKTKVLPDGLDWMPRNPGRTGRHRTSIGLVYNLLILCMLTAEKKYTCI